VNLFIVGCSVAPMDVTVPRRALTELLVALPFLDPAAIESWQAPSTRVTIVAVAHSASVGEVHRYTAFEPERAALFAGRPVRWSDGGNADGRAPLDAASYHPPAERWAAQLDGRCTVVRADDAGVELFSDPLGAYPVFEARQESARWFSNSAEALRLLSGDRGIDEDALASVLAGGWSLGGNPIWRAVRRVPRGVVLWAGADGGERSRELLPLREIASLPGARLDTAQAAGTLTALTGALADWPGRPNVVPVTGGRDSRLVLAAAVRAGINFVARTGGAKHDPDVVVAARLCELIGVPHGLLAGDPHGDRFTALQRAAQVTALASGGTSTLADADGFPLGPRPSGLPVWHSGQGGEIARSYYGPGRAGVADLLYNRFVGRRPGRAEIVSAEVAATLRRRIQRFVDELRGAGAAEADVPDLFYLLERMACWAAPTHGVVELVRDTTSPLWSARMLPHLFALPPGQRAQDAFHRQLLGELAPELVNEPFADRSGWPPRTALGRRAQRGASLIRKATAELERRAAGAIARTGSPAPEGPDPFDAVLATVREAAHSAPQHSAWSVLDVPRVTRLLSRPAAELDYMSRTYVWRLASAFLGLG
jgi:hypothetical protein